MTRWWLWLALLGWMLAVTSGAQTQNPEHARALDAMGSFLERIGDPDAAEFRTKVALGRIDIGPTQDPAANAEAQPGRDQVRLNQRILAQVVNAKGVVQPREVISWAGTWKHERTHTLQRRPDWTLSYWQDAAGQGNFCETQAWGAGFQAYLNWFRTTQDKLKSSHTPEEKKRLLEQLTQLGDIFTEYQQNYQRNPGYAPARVDGPDGDGGTVRVADVLAEITQAGANAAQTLKEEFLTVAIRPTSFKAKAGEKVPFLAVVKGGFPKYNYTWTWNGSPLAEGRTCTVEALKSGTLAVQVVDGGLSKANASAALTVSQSVTVSLPGKLQVRPAQEFHLKAQVQGGSGKYTYTWTRDGLPLPIRDSAITDKRDKDCQYTVEILDKDGNTASAHCDIVVAPPLAVTLPSRVAVAPGAKFRLEAKTQGGRPPFTYRWRRDDTLIKLSSAVGEGTAKSNITLKVEVVDAVGQIASATCQVQVTPEVKAPTDLGTTALLSFNFSCWGPAQSESCNSTGVTVEKGFSWFPARCNVSGPVQIQGRSFSGRMKYGLSGENKEADVTISGSFSKGFECIEKLTVTYVEKALPGSKFPVSHEWTYVCAGIPKTAESGLTRGPNRTSVKHGPTYSVVTNARQNYGKDPAMLWGELRRQRATELAPASFKEIRTECLDTKADLGRGSWERVYDAIFDQVSISLTWTFGDQKK